ncbi:zf-HC2 domain-containing protein [Micromonospora profundi]|uniref:Zf-HC2 domain-containing protein n=1 Tax=Micromonospora profundi TaxID=1420889 RepID=A0AAJ6L6Z6_9ACTN|nr:zf-HC2 domain-containing protein [Micromonospora profundi]WLS48808.1 zf-HC2 domain-containing protein [Micromonospora profundi]
MRTGEENPTAEHATLARYLLGALDEPERVAFEAHLAGCWECLSAAGDMGSVTSALPELDAADWEALAALPPEVVPPTEPATSMVVPPATGSALPPDGLAVGAGADPADAAADSARAVVDPVEAPAVPAEPPSDGPPAEPPSDGPPAEVTVPTQASGGADVARRRGNRGGAGPRAVGSDRPSGSRPGPPAGSDSRPGRPPGDPRRRRLKLWAGVAAAVLAVVLAGGGVVAGLGLTNSDVVLTANGEAPAQGVSLAVTITTDEDRSSIKVTAIGLRQGLRYRLFGVTRDGATHVIRDWTASSGPQEVSAELSLPVNDLAFVTVGLADGTAIVTAPISR